MTESAGICGCGFVPPLGAAGRREPADAPVEPTPEELEAIRAQLAGIEKMLGSLFGRAYSPGQESERARAEAADLIERHFEGIVAQWAAAIAGIFVDEVGVPGTARYVEFAGDLSNALIRFVAHLRARDDLRTYVYLRRHCREGMLSRAKPAQFATVHIALKEIVVRHVRAMIEGERMEVVRDAAVAAVDETRLMVAQFYIESREHALRASEQKYRDAVNHAPDPMYEIDPQSRTIIGANAAAEALYRSLPHEDGAAALVGLKLEEVGSPEMPAQADRHIEAVIANGFDQVFDLPLKGRYFDVNSAMITTDGQRFIHVILHDVTQRREMLEELLKAERLAAAGTFAAGVAHEVNNPLASICSLVQSLLAGETDPERRQALHTILSQITRISTTLKDLVNFARPSSAEKGVLDLNALVTDSVRLVAYNKRFDGITLDVQLGEGLSPAYADGNGIQQVLLNLLLNAVDAIKAPGGVIRVVTENLDVRHNGMSMRKVLIKVIDNGVGIAREHLERVFDPFFTTKQAGVGMGLGLSICQRIVLDNRGTIRVQSEVGKGTVITICLPAGEGAAEGRAVTAQ